MELVEERLGKIVQDTKPKFSKFRDLFDGTRRFIEDIQVNAVDVLNVIFHGHRAYPLHSVIKGAYC